MVSIIKSIFTALVAVAALYVSQGEAITPNPIISHNKPVYGYPAGFNLLTNGKFQDVNWNAASTAWLAINVGAGPSRIFICWNNPAYTWSTQVVATPNCPQTVSWISAYEILTSANSTNGTDGQWDTATAVTGNTVTARGHLVNFTGKSWVKLHITTGGGTLDEVEVYDASQGYEDTWAFLGTSISANTYKNHLPATAKTFAALVAAAHPAYYPAMIRGGIPCINSAGMATNITKYLALVGNVHYWAIEMGTNDGWNNGTYYLDSFKINMQTIITACKNAGVTPIIARPMSTNPAIAGWQLDSSYVKAVDQLAASNNLMAGPDFYHYFLAHPAMLDQAGGGVHPDSDGCAAIQQMWATAMDGLYPTTGTANPIQPRQDAAGRMTIAVNGNKITCRSACPGTVSIVSASGTLIHRINVENGIAGWVAPSKGLYVVTIESRAGIYTVRSLVR